MRSVDDRYSDARNKGFCVHCGSRKNQTRDHVPSRIFLDDPLPTDLPVTHACFKCNNGFSRDEEYLACLLKCVSSGHVDPSKLERAKIARILGSRPKLMAMLMKAKLESGGEVTWRFDASRVENVVLKLARGHAAYELNEPKLAKPDALWFKPLIVMGDREREEFEIEEVGPSVWPEIGSRAMNRLLIVGDKVFEEGWLLVQQGRYRYRTSQDSGLRVRMVLREYLACEVIWE